MKPCWETGFRAARQRCCSNRKDRPKRPLGNRLALESLQQEEDQFFTMSVDAKGEQLTVSPYRGEYGELSIKTDDHAPQKVGLAGSFYGKDRSRFSLGDFYAADFSRQYRIPAGDYRASLYVDYGDRAGGSVKPGIRHADSRRPTD